MPKWQFTKGLHDLGQGSFAYLQPDGSWGWSNAGLITHGEESLLVDTLFDLHLTRDMLKDMCDAAPQAERIGTLVNTHANGDHTFGNQLVEGATIIASAASAAEMAELPPQALADIMRNASEMGEAGAFLKTSKTVLTPDIQFHFAALSSDLPGSSLHPASNLHETRSARRTSADLLGVAAGGGTSRRRCRLG